MSERISIKGKGAELFFGDEAPDNEAPQRPADLAATQNQTEPDRSPGGEEPGALATMPPSAQETAGEQPAFGGDRDLVWRLRDRLREDHELHYSYRFTREEIESLRDVVYELEAKRSLRATRNDVVRLGLNWVLDDYRARGKESLLMQVLKEEKWSDRS